MTTTPTIWKPGTISCTDTGGSQFSPHIAGLTNDGYVVVWAHDASGAGLDVDVKAQRFSAEGVRIGSAFSLTPPAESDAETPAGICAMPDGGFVVAYADTESDAPDLVRIARFNAFGSQTFSTSFELAQANLNLRGLDVSTAGNYILSLQAGGFPDFEAKGIVFDGLTNAAGSQIDIATNRSGTICFHKDTTALSDGTFATAFTELGNTETLKVKVYDSSGSSQISPITIAQGVFTTASIVGLAGGGFVMAWDSVAGIGYRVADATGALGDTLSETSGTHVILNEKCVALKDGGFFLTWFDDFTDRIVGQRYDAARDRVGNRLLVASNASGNNSSQMTLTADGRILMTYGTSGGEVKDIIIDPRDNVIDGTSASETITTQIGDSTLSGKGGNDILLGQAGNDTIRGNEGGDTAMGGRGNDLLFGDAGTDRLEGGLGADVLDGGDGLDTAAYSRATAGVIVNLATGAGSLHHAEGDKFISIENVEGSEFADLLIGNSGDNRLDGRGGGDDLRGGDGSDTLRGGNGNDTLSGGLGTDVMEGGASDDRFIIGDGDFGDRVKGGFGVDTLDLSTITVRPVTVNLRDGTVMFDGFHPITTLSGIEIVIGTDGDDTIDGSDLADTLIGGKGNDEFVGNGGADTFDGGDGNSDHVEYNLASASVNINLATGLGSGAEAEGDVFISVENAGGSQFDDVLVGNDVRNILYAANGDDMVSGGRGDDLLQGAGGDDVLNGGAGNDMLIGGDGLDLLTGGSGADIFRFRASGETALGAASDLIKDFQQGLDKIDLKDFVFTFVFIGQDAFSKTAGEVRFASSGNGTSIFGDVNGDGDADFQIRLSGGIGLVETDFLT